MVPTLDFNLTRQGSRGDSSSWYVRSPPEEQITNDAVNRTPPQATPRFFGTAPRVTERQVRAMDQRRLPIKPPPDLKRYAGKFATSYIGALLKFGRNRAAHGSEEMRVWVLDSGPWIRGTILRASNISTMLWPTSVRSKRLGANPSNTDSLQRKCSKPLIGLHPYGSKRFSIVASHDVYERSSFVYARSPM
jgi:hypothetical protein